MGGTKHAAPSSWRAALLRARAASFLSLPLGVTRLARFSALARCSSEEGTIGMAWKAPVRLAACQQHPGAQNRHIIYPSAHAGAVLSCQLWGHVQQLEPRQVVLTGASGALLASWSGREGRAAVGASAARPTARLSRSGALVLQMPSPLLRCLHLCPGAAHRPTWLAYRLQRVRGLQWGVTSNDVGDLLQQESGPARHCELIIKSSVNYHSPHWRQEIWLVLRPGREVHLFMHHSQTRHTLHNVALRYCLSSISLKLSVV